MLLLMAKNPDKKVKEKTQKIPVPHGEGIFVNANGKTIVGKWKNGVYQAKKQKKDKKEIDNK
jgi:hypothetical protein